MALFLDSVPWFLETAALFLFSAISVLNLKPHIRVPMASILVSVPPFPKQVPLFRVQVPLFLKLRHFTKKIALRWVSG
jgi:hypothetical protein